MIVVLAGLGGIPGAVYTPLLEIVPTTEFPPLMPFTLHVYVAGFFEPLCTTLNCVLWEAKTAVAEGEMVKVGAITVTAAWPDFDESATLLAATVTIDTGITAGAVYSPPVEMVPLMESPPATPLTLQVTPVLDKPLTVAANC